MPILRALNTSRPNFPCIYSGTNAHKTQGLPYEMVSVDVQVWEANLLLANRESEGANQRQRPGILVPHLGNKLPQSSNENGACVPFRGRMLGHLPLLGTSGHHFSGGNNPSEAARSVHSGFLKGYILEKLKASLPR